MYLTRRDILEAEHKKLCNLLKVVNKENLADADFVVSVAAISEVRATVELTHDLLEMEENN